MSDLLKLAENVRRAVIDMAYRSGAAGSHVGGSLSCVEILSVLYDRVMKYTQRTPQEPSRDRFLLSKGHGAIALYAVLHSMGVLPEEDILHFKHDGSDLWIHPSMDILHGIEFSSGSLGQGLSLGAGVALALRRKNNPAHVYVLLGDGECDEGSVWEAASFAAHHNLTNLTVIIDENQLQLDAPTREIIKKDALGERWGAFGFDVLRVDGHNVNELLTAFAHHSEKPTAILARTIKGKGVSFMENNPEWHFHPLTAQQYEQALKELKND